jgi:UDP-N-acetylmuramyl pentapeptide phosphotransferase/UDP-N-acetylglucosamine-1-phosphate transferase
VVSFLDDIYTLRSKVRFPFQLVSIILVLVQLGIFSMPLYLSVIFLFLGLAVMNMFNFMDGVNGITGFYSLVVLSSFYILNLDENLIADDLLIYSIIAVIIFCFFNFRKKALFFAGDIGSISIGLLLFFIGLFYAINFNSPLFLLMVIVYGADAGNTLIYRKLFTKESVFDPHRHHIYQKLVDYKILTHLQVSLIYGLLQLIVNLVLLQFYKASMFLQWTLFFSLIIGFILLYMYIFKRLKVLKTNFS